MNVIIDMIGNIGGNMNRKGQALIEFVLILPIFIFVLFAIIDFGIIFSTKYDLENDSSDIVDLFNKGTSLDDIKKIYKDEKINIFDDGEFYKLNISTSINLITPGFNRIFGDPYIINVERIVPYA
jgi:hypothetical protein